MVNLLKAAGKERWSEGNIMNVYITCIIWRMTPQLDYSDSQTTYEIFLR